MVGDSSVKNEGTRETETSKETVGRGEGAGSWVRAGPDVHPLATANLFFSLPLQFSQTLISSNLFSSLCM